MKKAKNTLHAMSIAEVKENLSGVLSSVQEAPVVITRHGRPAAVLVGVAGMDILEVAERFGGKR